MLKRFGKKFIFLRRGGRGSAIIVVLVTMTFVVVLASILLYLSLVNIQMKTLDKGSKSNFYSAESVMNEIRAGIQNSVSEAIKTAYSDVLVSYNTLDKEAQTERFTDLFYETLYDTQVASEPLFTDGGTGYNADLLINFVSSPAGVDIDGSQNVAETMDENGDVASIAMKGIVVRYIDRGYETTISSDILITTPPLPYTSTSITQTPAPSFAIIARGLLEQPIAGALSVGISGSVYAGGLKAECSKNASFTVSDADSFIMDGPVTLSGGALTFSMNSNLWATDITLDKGARIALSGEAYIADDLNLLGSGTSATLGMTDENGQPTGRYFGYGDSNVDPKNSSAILINGRNTLLDMSGLRTLMLAGRSYVAYTEIPDHPELNEYVMMGESISVKSNQLAYLLPEKYLVGITNPYQDLEGLSNEELAAFVNLEDETLAPYGITNSLTNIQYIRKSVGAANIVYLCLKFPTPADANAYFRNYYNANTPMVQKYLDLYTDGVILRSEATKNLAGEAFTFDGTELGPLIDAYGVPQDSINGIKDSYASLCVTLSTADTGGGAANAYEYFVNTQELAIVSGTKLYPLEEETKKVVVTNGSYTINDDTDDSIHLVIAGGDVTVSRDFTGLILAGGDVTLYRTVTQDSVLVSDALKALINDEGGIYTYLFLNPEHISPLNISSNTDDLDGWNLNALVTYQNWTKNEA